MQPNSASQQYPTSGYQDQREPGGRPGFVPLPPQVGIVRVRAWLVGSIAGLVMLVLIAGLANQGVADQIRKHSLNSRDFFDNVVQASTVYGWRFSPQFSTDLGRVWIAGIIFDVLVVVLTVLITAALAKNKRGFGGAFLAAWVAAFVATQISSYVRASIVDLKQLQGQAAGKSVVVFFSQFSPGAYSAFAGLGFGLLAALIAGAVAAATQRTEVLAEPAASYPAAQQPEEPRQRPEPQEREVWAAPPPPGPISSPSPWTTPERSDRPDLDKRDARDEPQPTAVLPVMGRDHGDAQRRADDESEPTQAYRVPREDEATQAHRVQPEDRVQPQDEGESTQAYRVRPEDERDRP